MGENKNSDNESRLNWLMEKSGLNRGTENQGVEAGRQLDEAADTDHQDVTDQEADHQKDDHPEDPIETEAAAEVETGVLDDPGPIQDKHLMKETTTKVTEKDKMKEKITDIREKFYVKTEFDLLLLL